MAETQCEGKPLHPSVESAIQHLGAGFDTPWWGTKCSANLVNVGMVIGREKSPGVGWRLDYDPVKGLHINYEDTTGREKVSIYHKIAAPLFGSAEGVMEEYWISWTKRER